MPVALKFFQATTGQLRVLQAADTTQAALVQQQAIAGWTLLSSQAVVEIETKATTTPATQATPSWSSSREKLDTAWWCRELRGLLLAGMTVVEAIDTLRAQKLGAARDALHAQLVERLQEGQALSTAMKSTGAFPAVLVAGVKASERTSTLVAALDDYLRYHELLDNLRKKVISAAIYPSIVLSLGVLIVLFLLTFVIPRFSQMFAGGAAHPGKVTRAMLWVSQTLHQHAPLLLALLLVFAVAVFWAVQQGVLGRWASAMAEAIGPLRRHIYEFRLAKLYQSMTLMVRGGYAVAESLEQCAELELGSGMRERLLQARAELEQGKRVSAALANAQLTDTVTSRLLAIAERTGNFDYVLQTVAQRHAASFITFIERTTRVVEPLMLLAASLLVGSVVVMMYMPVFDISSSIK